MSAWAAYHPSGDQPWNLRRVVHLHRRAGFAATWDQIQRDLKEGPEAAISRVLQPASQSGAARDEFEQMATVIGDAAVASGNINRLKAWWLYRMIFTADPLTEKLALLWHNHFATSNLKVENVAMMRRQNETFRTLARARFGEMLTAAAKDPALLVWLDADANRKEHPNENLAREIMELFTLGVGNYTEGDVKQAARALTGWSVKGGQFRSVSEYHDSGEKTIFGKTGAWNGDDLLVLLLDQPATARRLAFRIVEQFMGEGAVDDKSLVELADGLRKRELDIGWAVETVLRSEAFFSERNIASRVLSPVEYIVGAIRSLEMLDPPPSTLLLAEWTANLGQDLFYPPNVFGWPGGRPWLTSRALIGRANFATSIIAGTLHNPAKPFEATELARRYSQSSTDDIAAFYSMLLAGDAEALRDRSRRAGKPEELLASMLSSPRAQLG